MAVGAAIATAVGGALGPVLNAFTPSESNDLTGLYLQQHTAGAEASSQKRTIVTLSVVVGIMLLLVLAVWILKKKLKK